MSNFDPKAIRKRIIEGKARDKSSQSYLRKMRSEWSQLDKLLLLGCPFFSITILLCENEVESFLIGITILVNVLFCAFLENFSVLEKITYVLLNVAVITSGDKIKDFSWIKNYITYKEVLFTAIVNLFSVCFLWLLCPKKWRVENKSVFWDLSFILVSLVDISLALLYGRIRLQNIFHVLRLFKKLIPL